MTSYDEEPLGELVKALEPIAKTVLKLSEKNCDLMVGEGASIFLLKKLQESESTLTKELYDAVKTRLEQRRHKKLISALLFLHSGQFPKDNSYFKYDNKAIIKKTIKDLSSRLYPDSNEDSGMHNVGDDEPADDELENSIKNIFDAPNPTSSIEKEIKFLEATGQRSDRLDKIYQACKTQQVTSTISERVFSVGGSFSTKIRNRLSASKLNILVFLKYYFLRIGK